MASAAPRISVALGTRNGATFLREQLESILGQSRPVDEIVLSDDASSDGTCVNRNSFSASVRVSMPNS